MAAARRRAQLLACLIFVVGGLGAGVAGAAVPTPAPPTYRIVGYALRWLPGQTPDLRKIDTLILAFARLRGGRVALAPGAAKRLATLVALKARDPALEVDISIGGWGAGGFSEAAATAAGRRLFALSAAHLVTTHGADGIDIDWEYPTRSDSGIASNPADRTNFTLLLKAVRAALDHAGTQHGDTRARHYTLSIAVADGKFASGIDIAAVDRYIDWFNLMTYDFCNSMTPDTCHQTGLYTSKYAPPDARTTARAVREYLAAGVPPRKLVIGSAFYGREFGGVSPTHDGLYQPYKKFIAFVPWSKLKADFIGKHGFTRHWDAKADAAWLWNPKTHTFISYDDPKSIAAKATFVKAHHLGGIMYWEQSVDPRDELLDAIWKGLHQAQPAATD